VTQFTIAVLPGDGIGPEVTAEAERVLRAAADRFGIGLALPHYPVGAGAVTAAGSPLPADTRAAVIKADAVLLGAVGDPALDSAPRELKPETGLLALRSLLGVYANLRPVSIHPALAGHSPLRPTACTASTCSSCGSSPADCTTASRAGRTRSWR